MTPITLPKPGQPSLLDNVICPYCACQLGKQFDREHVIGRRFVPKGALQAAWNVRVNSCRACNARKATLENDISAITMHPPFSDLGDERRNLEFLRKAKAKSHLTGKPVSESREGLSVAINDGPLSLNMNFTSPPRLAPDRAFELARFQLQGFFYFLSYNPAERRGWWWPGGMLLISLVAHSDWGNERLRAFSEKVRYWHYRLATCTATGYFKALIKKHPDLAVWSWSLEWNGNFRLAGFFGEVDQYKAEINSIPFEVFNEMRSDRGHILRFRTERPLGDDEDALFYYEDGDGKVE